MASKSILFVFAFVLLVTTIVSSAGDVENIETEDHHNHHHHHHHHYHHHARAPAHAPAYAPAHAPAKASPPHHHAPAKSPVHSPPPHGCVAQCESYCKPVSPKRACMKTCTLCCAKCKCVPSAIASTNCRNWDNVEIHGHIVKCP